VYSGVDAKPKRTLDLKRLRNIELNANVALLVDHYSDDWDRVWWCRLDGRARVVSDGEDFRAGLAALAEKYHQYREAPPEGRVVVMEVSRATGWTAT
jgi:PPOX class probable F420-dependent enzyme